MITQLNLLRELVDFGVQLVSYRQASVPLLALTLQAFIVEEIWVNQENNLQAQRIKQNLEREEGHLDLLYMKMGPYDFRTACVYQKIWS